VEEIIVLFRCCNFSLIFGLLQLSRLDGIHKLANLHGSMNS